MGWKGFAASGDFATEDIRVLLSCELLLDVPDTLSEFIDVQITNIQGTSPLSFVY